MKPLILPMLAASLSLLFSCKKDDDNQPQLSYGAPIAMGNGNAKTWIETDDNHHPKTVGIAIDKKAFENLPEEHDEGHEHSHQFAYALALPSPSSTIFNHVVLNWNPSGHAPDHIYDKPHFDLHFYMISEAERNAIPDYAADSSGFLNYPAPAYLPATYFPIPGGEAKMGVHWADATSPELDMNNPQPFTQTFIYGSYNGKVTYYEPMATLSFLTTVKTYARSIPQPQKFAAAGYYPTRMSYTEKGDKMEIALHDFVYHEKS